MRDKWIDSVNNKLMIEDKLVRDLDKKLDEAQTGDITECCSGKQFTKCTVRRL